ncbi:GAF and ANTAR domain-containing protein [Rhodococcus sp. NPDC003318]|uniref:GAF and ANTAR domain-containing protein n=1 Tax=Rhodococcus sp. NPDC003318 TaxID=3364503 RepID=UPI0036BDECD6
MPSSTDRESELLQALVELADTLVDDYDIADLLHMLVIRCVDLTGAVAAGLMLANQRGGLQVLASSTEQTRLLELFQLQVDEGPCLEAFGSGETVIVEDLSTEAQRWPRFTPEALAQGFRSVQALPLRLRKQTIGALNLFGDQVGVLAPHDLKLARALADTATIGILHERAIRRAEVLTEQLQTALNNRITIEQAKGIIAHAGDLEMGQAFEVLRDHSRRTNTRLSAIAHDLVTGTIRAADLLSGSTSSPGTP